MIKSILLCLTFVATPHLAFGQSRLDSDFELLKKQRNAALEKAAEPINKMFVVNATQLLAKAIQNEDFELAAKLKKEIGTISIAPSKKPSDGFTDTYWKNTANDFVSMMRFESNGLSGEISYVKGVGNRVDKENSWSMKDASSAISGNLTFFILDGILVRNDGMKWQRSDLATFTKYRAAPDKALAVKILDQSKKVNSSLSGFGQPTR